MSQDIISTKFYDPNIEQVRTATQQHNDKYPFLLMPLRLETRYMTVDRPVAGYNADELEILILFLELEYLFEKMELMGLKELLEIESAAARIQEINNILNEKSGTPWTLPYPENEWCIEHMEGIIDTNRRLRRIFNRLPANEKNQLRNSYNIVQQAAREIKKYDVEKSPSTDYDEAKKLIDKLNYLDDIFVRIINKPGDYTAKTKHKYFNYLDSQTTLIKDICNDIEDMALKNIVANTSQINRITEFSGTYATKLTQTKNVFSNIKSDYKKAEFLGKYQNSLSPDINNISNTIDEVITPKLRYIKELKTVKASNLLYLAKKIQFELEAIIASGVDDYQQVRYVRTGLYGLLRKFRAMGHDIIIGPNWQVNQLRSTWSKVDNLLVDYTQLVGELNGQNRYERAGLSRSISHINENYRADLAGLKLELPEDRAFIQNSNFTESANAYTIAFGKIVEIEGYMNMLAYKQNPEKKDYTDAANMMQVFSDEFAVLATKTTIIPETYFKNIHNTCNRLQNSTNIISDKTKNISNLTALVNTIEETMQAVNQSVNQLESDITDERDPFYDDFRKKFIFGDPTETVNELWVRIYPDDVFINSHEKAVTQEELDDTKYFWTEVWNADNSKEVELAAWRPLSIKYGQNRATYLYRLLNPEKVQQSQSKPTRPIIDLKRRLITVGTTIDNILSSRFLPMEDQLHPIKNEITSCWNLVSPLTTETYVLLNEVIGVTREIFEKLKVLKSKIESWLISDSMEKITWIGDTLSQCKPVKDVTMLKATITPDFTSNIEIKENEWSEAPRTEIMPDKFVFVGMNGNEFTHIKTGKSIPNPLIVGINPTATTATFEYDNNGNLLMDENTKWMTDFDEAVDKGMGIIVPLKSAERNAGFEKIIVLGIKNSGAEQSKIMLEELLMSHAYSPEGIDMLPIGTPTNNTESKSSGFSSEEETDKTYERVTGEPLFNDSSPNKDNIDGYRLTEALGITSEVFNRIDHADNQDIYKSMLMNRSMWNSTMGYYMEEVMDSVFTLDNIRRTNDFFNNYVSGRGWLPAMRIGSQPYGILPTTAFSKFKTSSNEQVPSLDGTDFVQLSESALNQLLQKRFDIRFYKFLNVVREMWMDIVTNENLKIDDFVPGETTAQEHFMQLLGLQATSIEQYFRYNTNTAQRRSVDPDIGFTVNFSTDALYGPHNMQGLFGQFVDKGYFIDDTYFRMINETKRTNNMTNAEFESIVALSRIKESRIFRLRYHDNFGQLSGPFVRENGDAFLKSVNDNTFIDKLFTTEPKNLWNPDSFGELQSDSLFSMFLRQSLALSYRDAALNILMKENVINENTRRRAGSKGTYLLPGPNRDDIIFTKWDYLFQKLDGLQNMMRVSPFAKFPLAGNWTKSMLWTNIHSNNWSMADYLFQLSDNHVNKSNISELKNNFLELKELPVDELERLFAEHLDLCTYRFDAWQLGIANKRLNTMRKKNNGSEGIYLGAFGILENLMPGGDRTVTTDVPDQLKENDNKLVYTDDDNEGFIHTPSLNHALSAAILRSGYMSNREAGDLNNPMAVNLTSKRVRMALKLMQGIHNGQDTGALLGYQFERGLHENYLQQGIELDKFIYDLRKKFPLEPDADSESDINANKERSTMNVVNGLKLLESVRNFLGESALMNADSLYELELQNNYQLREHLELPANISTNQLQAILKEIDEMANAFDALGDLLMSESVYHIAQGNYVRSAAVFAALSEGRAPQEIQIINTPRSGHVLTQRLMLQLESISGDGLENNQQQAKAQHWQNIDLTPRSFAEPSLNKWLGEMIGDPLLIRCYVEYNHNDTDHVQLVRLSDLGMQAIDVIYTMSNPVDDGSHELNKLVAFYVRDNFDIPVETEISIRFKDRNNNLIEGIETLSAEIKTFNEVLPLFTSLYETVTKARFTAADDYVIPGEDVPDDSNLQQLDVHEIKLRTQKALSDFIQISDNFQLLFTTKGINVNDMAEVGEAAYTTLEINELRNALLACSRYGLTGSIPDAAIETTYDTGKILAKQSAAIMKVMREKITQAESLLNYGEDHDDKTKTVKISDAAKALFGSNFMIIPHFTLRNRENISEVLSLNPEDGLLRYAQEYAMDGWIEGIAKVRTKINKLEMVNTMAEMFDTSFPDYTPVQLPFGTIETESGETMNDYWLGLEYPSAYEPENDKLSLVILNEDYLNTDVPNAKCCGLLVDEWIEIIPQREETTGIAFNYDQPDAEPPQSMLLAVPPVETGNWKWDDLVYTILDTMDLYKARLVEPEHIDKSIFTQVLPAVMGEFPAPNEYREGIANLGMFDLKENNKDIND